MQRNMPDNCITTNEKLSYLTLEGHDNHFQRCPISNMQDKDGIIMDSTFCLKDA